MADIALLKSMFLERVNGRAEPAPGAEEDDRLKLLGLEARGWPLSHYLNMKTEEYKVLIRSDADGVLSHFFDSSASAFFRKIDYAAACSVLAWAHGVYRFCELTADWRSGKKHYELLLALWKYFTNPMSPYLSGGPGGLLACRMQKEYPFLPENAVFNILPLNVLWFQFLNMMNQLGQRYADIKVASASEELIRQFQEAFHAGFWDEAKGVLRFAWHPDSDFTIVSGLGLCAFQYAFDDLLYKQKKKSFLKEIWEVYYDDHGIKVTARDNETVAPELLPVYWRAVLKLNRFGGAKKREMLDLLDRHIKAVNPFEFLKNAPDYDRRMLEFLAEFRA